MISSSASLAALSAGASVTRAAEEVDLQLLLAIDCSYSVDAGEYDLQRQGIAAALLDPKIQEAVTHGPLGAVAIAVMQWSSELSQVLAVPWTKVDGPGSATRLAARVSATPRLTRDGGTSISAAIAFGLNAFTQAPYRAFRRIIDISGDGRSNNGPDLAPIREAAIATGVTINGLAILHEDLTLDYYFRGRVIGGQGAFVEIANDYSAYREAIRKKMLREISFVPVSGNPGPTAG